MTTVIWTVMKSQLTQTLQTPARFLNPQLFPPWIPLALFSH
jgi:hypothetical protein